MRLWIKVLAVVLGFLVTCSLSEAKGGKGKNKFKNQSRGDRVLGSPVITREDRFSSSFPRGNAWGLRRNLGLDNPGSRRDRLNRRDGDTIFRAGQRWEWDRRSDSWILDR